jgi:hypothetical protein
MRLYLKKRKKKKRTKKSWGCSSSAIQVGDPGFRSQYCSQK